MIRHEPDRLVGVKSVTSAEEYLGDHFPGFPVLPGVMMLEAMVQAGRLLLTTPSGDDREPARVSPSDPPLVVREVRNVTYGTMVRPGESLEVDVTLRGRSDDGWDFAGVGRVHGRTAVKGRFRLAPLPDADDLAGD